VNKYGPKAQRLIHKVMREFEEGELHSGHTNRVVSDRDQAIAIGIAKARQSGAKVPNNPHEY
jgi:hypothetical protein